MKSSIHRRWKSGAGAVAATLLLGSFAGVRTASAQEACGEDTCPKGYGCEQVPRPCLAIACAPGSECPVCEGTVAQCVPEACNSDADCDEHMICVTSEVTECTGATPACEPGAGDCANGADRAPADCTTHTDSQCVPRWDLQCQTAADCGAGFTCEEQLSCSCSGGGATGSAGSGSGGASSGGGSDPSAPAPPPPGPRAEAGGASGDAAKPAPGSAPPGAAPAPPGTTPTPAPLPPAPGREPSNCSCSPSGVSACVLIEQACETDAQCPSGWSCDDNPEGECWASSDGSSGCTPADPAKLCLPPYRDLGGYSGRGEVTNTGGSVPDQPPKAGGPTPGPIAPGTGSGTGEPISAPVAESAGDADAELDSRGGCSVAGTSGGGAGSVGAAGLLALLGLALRRPRRKSAHERGTQSRTS
jgi:MYXO-CTERM domain-containing protein